MEQRRPAVWEYLTRFVLLTWPFLLGWHIWVSQKVNGHDIDLARIDGWIAQGPRFTATDADNLRLRVITEIDAKSELRWKEIQKVLDEIRTALTRIQVQHESPEKP